MSQVEMKEANWNTLRKVCVWGGWGEPQSCEVFQLPLILILLVLLKIIINHIEIVQAVQGLQTHTERFRSAGVRQPLM